MVCYTSEQHGGLGSLMWCSALPCPLLPLLTAWQLASLPTHLHVRCSPSLLNVHICELTASSTGACMVKQMHLLRHGCSALTAQETFQKTSHP